MPICKNCGVELKSGSKSCPLCGLSLNGTTTEDIIEVENQKTIKIPRVSRLGFWIWELFTFLMISGFIVVFMVDFAFEMSISWSKIPLLAIIYSWSAVTVCVRLKRKVSLLVLIEFLLLLGFLGSLDLLIPGKPWFRDFVLPLLICTGVIFEITVALIHHYKLQTLAAVSVSFVSLGVFLLCLEALLYRFLYDQITVSWSLVAVACLISISGFIIYVKKRYHSRGKDLEKFFHT
ncbi:MAG: hypothetical protein JW996_02120 [Candidatus Cloacimonetes bacterium]|nr:hypothetical protein [Candidatus Cloacimonadota bacterium]